MLTARAAAAVRRFHRRRRDDEGGNISSFNSETGAQNTGNAFIGSNHAITINGGGGGDEQDYFTPNGSCSGCPNGHARNGPRPLPEPTAPSPSQACPTSGVFAGNV